MSHALRIQADGIISNNDFTKVLSALDPHLSPAYQHVFIDVDGISPEQMNQLTQAIAKAKLTNLEMAFTNIDEKSAKAFQEAVSNNAQINRARLELGTHLFHFSAQILKDCNNDMRLDFSSRAIIDCQSITPEQALELASMIKAKNLTHLTLTIREIDETVAETLAQAVNDKESITNLKLTLGNYTISKEPEEDDVVERLADMMIATVESNVVRVAEGMKGAASSILTQSQALMSALSSPFTQCVAQPAFDEGFDALPRSPKENEKAALGKLV